MELKLNMDEYLPLREVVFEALRDAIVHGEFEPGERLLEVALAKRLGVSRTPVRSALMRLAYDGLIQQQPNRGAVVAKPSATDLRQVYEARAVLEVGAFRAAVHRRSDESVLQMEQNLQKQQDLTNLFNMTEYVRLNREFHWIITMEAQNAYYEKYLNELQNKVATYLLFWDSSTTNSLSLDLHLRIFEAFRDRDEQKGVLALMEDLQLAEECVRESQQL